MSLRGQKDAIKVWGCQKGGQKPQTEERQTIQSSKEKDKKGKTMTYKNTTQKTNDRATCIPLKTGSDLMCSERVSSPCIVAPVRKKNERNAVG